MRSGRPGAVLAAACSLAVAATLLACASTSGQKGAAAGDSVVCTNEALTGSHIVEPRCYRRSEIEERRRADRAVVDRMIIQANRPVRTP